MDEDSGALAQLREIDYKIHQKIDVPVETAQEKQHRQERQVITDIAAVLMKESKIAEETVQNGSIPTAEGRKQLRQVATTMRQISKEIVGATALVQTKPDDEKAQSRLSELIYQASESHQTLLSMVKDNEELILTGDNLLNQLERSQRKFLPKLGKAIVIRHHIPGNQSQRGPAVQQQETPVAAVSTTIESLASIPDDQPAFLEIQRVCLSSLYIIIRICISSIYYYIYIYVSYYRYLYAIMNIK